METEQSKALIEAVASGLRRMDSKPDALLFFNEYSPAIYWDLPNICAIEVFHTDLPASSMMYSYSCPFYPIFKGKMYSGNDFIKGFEDGLNFDFFK